MMSEKYRLSFTAAGFRLPETVIVGRLFNELYDWSDVTKHLCKENPLGLRSASSSKRVSSELMQRLKTLSADELKMLISDSTTLQRTWTWIAICRTYTFVADFIQDVILSKFMVGQTRVSVADFEQFFEGKAITHPELIKVTDRTRAKLRQTLFKMLVEAEILTKEKEIIPATFTPAVLSDIPRENYSFFPMYVQEAT